MTKTKKEYIYKHKENLLVVKDYFEINLFDKTYNLKYRTRIYKKFDKEKHSIEKVKKHGYSVKLYQYETYALVWIKDLSIQDRIKIINKILDLKIENDGTNLLDEINRLWELNVTKDQSKRLEEFDTKCLEVLSDFFIAGLEGDDILDEKRWEKIKKYELSVTTKKAFDAHGSELKNQRGKGRVTQKTFENRHRSRCKRWNNSLNKKYYSVIGKFINLDEKYDSIWEYVNQENKFNLCGGEFLISDKVKNYKLVNETSPMFKILVITQNGNVFYFDEKYNNIEAKFIEKVEVN